MLANFKLQINFSKLILETKSQKQCPLIQFAFLFANHKQGLELNSCTTVVSNLSGWSWLFLLKAFSITTCEVREFYGLKNLYLMNQHTTFRFSPTNSHCMNLYFIEQHPYLFTYNEARLHAIPKSKQILGLKMKRIRSDYSLNRLTLFNNKNLQP